MSSLLFPDDVTFVQRLLRGSGCYDGLFSGTWDAQTDTAEREFVARLEAIATQEGTFDARSETCLHTLHLTAQRLARRFLTAVRAGGVDARIISGTRSYAAQNELYRRGRFGNPPPRVTNARGGQSRHNFGFAWDIGIFAGGAYLTDSPLYDQAAALGAAEGIEWGGAWATFKDRPHYQVATGLSVAEMRARFEQGQPFG